MVSSDEQECIDAYNNLSLEVEVGDLVFTKPNPPEDPSEIINYGLPKKDRKFPYYKESITMSNGGIVRYEDSLSDSEYEDLVYREQDRLDNGIYFYNGNTLEYVTGFHYIGLQWFVVPDAETGDSKKPSFIDAQRDAFYHWQWCYENPTLGAILGTCRRFGKTLVGIIIAYIIAISKFNSRVAIQSKTMPDAENIFSKLQEYWQKMPAFLKPTDTGDTRVKNRLVFAEPKKRSTKQGQKEYGVQLNSMIFAVPSKETALDGQRLTFGYFDEEGKSPEIDVNERWAINSKCFLARRNIVGKSLHTSTVEDMEKRGGENFKKIWDKSNVDSIDDVTKRTASGLRRLFIPAYMGFDVDEWGYSDMESSKEYHLAEMSKLKGKDLISYRRQYPLEESDMWLMEDDGSRFDLPSLYSQRQWNEENGVYERIRTGKLYWKNGVRFSGVVFNDDPKGQFNIAAMPPKEAQCAYTELEGQRRPTCSYFRMGVDPTDSRSPASGRGSDNAAYVMAMPSVIGYKRKTPVAQYIYRHASPNDFYEDMLLLAFFYSCPILVERNRGGGMCGYFEDKGALGFIMKDPREKDPNKADYMMPSSGEDTRSSVLLNPTESYVVENVGYIAGEGTFGDFAFDELIADMIDFAPTTANGKWTKWDAVVAFMYANAACGAKFHISSPDDYGFDLSQLGYK